MAIIDNIRHYWKLDESSGNVTGEVDSYVMTNISTIRRKQKEEIMGQF